MSGNDLNDENSQVSHNAAMRFFERDKAAFREEFAKDFKTLVDLDKRKVEALERIAQKKTRLNGFLLGLFIAAAGAFVAHNVDELKDAVEKQTEVIANSNSCAKAPAPVLNK